MREYSKKKGPPRPGSRAIPPRPSMLSRPSTQGRSRRRGRILLAGAAAMIALALLFSLRYVWREKRYRFIVIHHTASDVGNLEYYRRLHMEERGWPDIAYHFLINNGSANTAMGQIEESALWKSRSIGYSTRDRYINMLGIAVVLVGNFENHKVPSLQREALVNLATSLAREYGVPPERIVGHREISSTACPGKTLNMASLREDVRRNLGGGRVASPREEQ